MKRFFAIIATMSLTSVFMVTGMGTAQATPTDPNADHKVTVCHRTASVSGGELKNGYNEITVDIASSGLVKGGHTGHEQVGNGPGPDIIPAYEAFAKVKGQWKPFSYKGLNLEYVLVDGTTGAEFLANGCQLNNPQEPPLVTEVDDTRMSCEAGLEAKTYTTVTPYIWDSEKEEWVLDIDNAVTTSGEWFFVRDLTNKERAELKCDRDIVINLRQVKLTCDGFFVRNVEITTAPDGTVTKDPSKWFKLRNATKAEKTRLECLTPIEPNDPPKNNPEKPTEPSEPTLPHTGANLWLALIGTLAVGGGAALMWASRRKLTGI
jgi:LPXTG-motif cell wall-anchored protein